MSSLFKKMLTKFLKFPCSSTRWAASFLFPSNRVPIASETVPAAIFTWDTEPPSVYCRRGVGIITLTNFSILPSFLPEQIHFCHLSVPSSSFPGLCPLAPQLLHRKARATHDSCQTLRVLPTHWDVSGKSPRSLNCVTLLRFLLA